MGTTKLKSEKRVLQDVRESVLKSLEELQAKGAELPEDVLALVNDLTLYHQALDDQEQSIQTAMVSLAHDMSQTSQALSETGMRLEGILEAAEDVAFIITQAGEHDEIIEFNSGAEKIFGCTKAEAMGCDPSMFYAGDAADHRIAKSGTRTLMQRKSGERFPALYSAYPLKNAHGQTTATLIIVLDILKQEIAERFLKETHEKYKALAEATPVSIMAFDLEGTVTFVNDWHMRMLDKGHIQPEFYIGKKIYDIQSIVRVGVSEKVKAVLKGASISLEDVYIPPFGDREEAWQNIRSSPLMESGQFKGGILIREDVTRRKHIEHDLKLLIDSSPIPLIKVELTESGGIIRSLNPEAVEMLGPGALGKHVRDYITPMQEDGDELSTMHGERCEVRTQQGLRQAIRTAHKSSGQFEVQAVMDVTVLIKAKEAAEDASKAKSDFLANISHEIRTPLNVLLGMLQLFQERDLGEELNEMASYATGSAKSLLALLNDILDFSVLELGSVSVDNQSFDLVEIIEMVAQPYRVQANEKGIKLDTVIDENVPETLVGDPRRIRQVIFQLIGNSVKFTDKGSVRVEATLLSDTVREGRGLIAIVVSDTGIGITDEQMVHVFEPFRQADGSRTRRHGGTGIGLSLVNEFVTAMGGTIAVNSEFDQGTEFLFTVNVGVAQ